MKNKAGQTLYEIVAFDNSDGNYTANPRPMACNLSQATARKMLESYRQIGESSKRENPDNPKLHFRYIMCKQ